MVVHKCDRCKKEFENICPKNNIEVGSLMPDKYELCNDCMKKFYEFLKGKKLK